MDCLPNPQRGAVIPEPAHGLKFTQALDQMHEELGAVLARLTPDMAETLIQEVETAPRIFGCAAGRSGFILRGFLMRLMHLGFTVYFVGRPLPPGSAPATCSWSCRAQARRPSPGKCNAGPTPWAPAPWP